MSMPRGRGRRGPAATDPAVARAGGAACLTGIAVAHAADLEHKLEEAPYVAALFAGAIVAAVALALALELAPRARTAAWRLSSALAVTLLAAFVASRTVGLPQLEDHVGHWLDGAALAALGFEGALVAIAGRALRPRRAPRRSAAPARRGDPVAAAAPAVAAVLVAVSAGGALAEWRGDPGATGAHAHAGAARAAHAERAMLTMSPAGRVRFGAPALDVDAATGAERAAAARLLDRVRATAARLSTIRAAEAEGYVVRRSKVFHAGRFVSRPGPRRRVHLHHAGHTADAAVVDPARPESLVFERRAGRLHLAAFMFRAPTGRPPATPAGRFLRWHLHGGCMRPRDVGDVGITVRDRRCGRRRVLHHGSTMMVHVWLAPTLAAAYEMHPR